jgi:hypothetical protein
MVSCLVFWSFPIYFHDSAAVVPLLDYYFNRPFRQDWLHQLRPLDEAEGIAVHVLLEPEVEQLFQLLYPVAVEVVDGCTVGQSVLVDDGERGARYGLVYSQLLADGLDEGGLADPHIPVECKHRAITHRLDESAGGCLYPCRIVYLDSAIHSFASRLTGASYVNYS